MLLALGAAALGLAVLIGLAGDILVVG